jgi:hypothetical protein
VVELLANLMGCEDSTAHSSAHAPKFERRNYTDVRSNVNPVLYAFFKGASRNALLVIFPLMPVSISSTIIS